MICHPSNIVVDNARIPTNMPSQSASIGVVLQNVNPAANRAKNKAIDDSQMDILFFIFSHA